jgi:hypothetical protein
LLNKFGVNPSSVEGLGAVSLHHSAHPGCMGWQITEILCFCLSPASLTTHTLLETLKLTHHAKISVIYD